MNKRIEPFLDLLDVKYLPLLFAYAPQAYTVYAWQLASGAPNIIAILAGIAFEFISVGAIAWSERGAGWKAARYSSVTALLFSVAVSVAYYGRHEGALSVLHAGFPLVGYFYTLLMHSVKPVDTHVTSLQAELTQARIEIDRLSTELTTTHRIVNAIQVNVSTPVDTRKADVKSLVDSGVTISDAARQVGVSRQTATK